MKGYKLLILRIIQIISFCMMFLLSIWTCPPVAEQSPWWISVVGLIGYIIFLATFVIESKKIQSEIKKFFLGEN